MRRAPTLIVPALAAALLLAGCAGGPPPKAEPPALPASFAGQPASASPVLAADWWKQLQEPELDALVAQVLAANLDLRLAALRVDEAAVAVTLARSAQWPTVEMGSAVTRSRSSQLNGQQVPVPEATTHRVALATSFEIDLWGKLRDATQAAREQLLAAQHARDTVRLALIGTLAQAWLGVRSLDRQQALLDAQWLTRRDALALVQRRVQAGVASGLDQAQAEGALAALGAQRVELQRQRAQLVHAIAELAGQPGLQVAVNARPLAAPVAVPAGLPSDLLQRRPDLQQAEAAMRAAFAAYDVTRKSAWPTLALTGSFGAQSADLADLLRSGARIWSIGPSLLVSLFDAGRNEARTGQARTVAEQAAVGWQRATQTAFREVADALVAVEQLALQEAEVERQQRAAQDTLRLATRRYEAGYSAYLEVLDAQRGTQEVDLGLLRLRQARLDASVALMKALGGGWTAPAEATARR
jgi:multidrug efflux system outer membrane protein